MKQAYIIAILLIFFTGCEKKPKTTTCGDSNITDISKIKIIDIALGDRYEDHPELKGPQFIRSHWYYRGINNIFSPSEDAFGNSLNHEIPHLLQSKTKSFILQGNNAEDGSISIYFDQNHSVAKIIRHKKFLVKPDFDQIIKQLYQKYGKPDMQAKNHSGSITKEYRGQRFAQTDFCWGSCARTVDKFDEPHKKYYGDKVSHASCGKSLIVRYRDVDQGQSSGREYSITFTLYDPERINKEIEWEKNMRKILEKERRKNESNLNL